MLRSANFPFVLWHHTLPKDIKKLAWTRWWQLQLSKLLPGSWKSFFSAAGSFFIYLVPPFVCPYSRNWYHPKQAITVLQHMGIHHSKTGSGLAESTETLAGSSWYKSYFFWMVPQSVFLPPLLWASRNPRNLRLVDGKVANAHTHTHKPTKMQLFCVLSMLAPNERVQYSQLPSPCQSYICSLKPPANKNYCELV